MNMLSDPLISVLITVFNRERYLATAIESALAQTLRDIEIIVLDDCSTDASWEIAQRYGGDPRVRLHRNEFNLGQFPTRNKIAGLARGKYLKYLDSDDALLPHCLETMAHMMERHPEAGMLLWSSEGDNFYPFLLAPLDAYRRGFAFGARFDRAPLSTLLRKDCFDVVGGFDSRWALCADTEIIYRLARYFPVIFGPHGLVYYRIHPGQVFTSEHDGHNRRAIEEVNILIATLRHPDCPLLPEERAWHLARMIYGALRKSFDMGFRQGRWKAAWGFLGSLNISLAEMLPALRKRPEPPPVALPGSPDWEDFPLPPAFVASTPPLVSVIVAPGGNTEALRLCLESLRRQDLAQIEVLVVLDEGQREAAALLSERGDGRFRSIAVQPGLATVERFNHAVSLTKGIYLKLIGPDCPLLYPYALEIETAILEKRPAYPFISSGSAAFSLGGFALTPREALSLDAGSDGGCLRVDPSCVLFRRASMADDGFDARLGSWAFVSLLYRLAGRSGAILGPYGLSTAWRRDGAVPPGELSADIERQATDALSSTLTDSQPLDWHLLRVEGQRLAEALKDRCRWDEPSWVLADTRPEGVPCHS